MNSSCFLRALLVMPPAHLPMNNCLFSYEACLIKSHHVKQYIQQQQLHIKLDV